MPNISSTIWYGTFHEPEPGGTLHLRPALNWIVVLACFAAFRFLLPFRPTDADMVHSGIVDALANSLLWGRQSLIASFEFPTFVTICLMFAEQVAKILPTSGTRLLVVLAQTWTFFYLLRIPSSIRGRIVTTATFLALVTSAEFQAVFFRSDPNWISTVPIAGALYHLTRWQQYNALRDAILLAVCCGLLAFCGPSGLVCGLALLCVATLNIQRLPRLYDTQNMKGVGLLLWAPLVYCLMLLLLANWLIMRDGFFPIRSLAPALSRDMLLALPRRIVGAGLRMPWICVGGLIISLCSVVGRRRVAAEGLAAGLVALFLLEAVFGQTPVHVPGGYLIRMILGVSAVLFPGLFLFELFESSWQRNATIALTGATLFAGIAFPRRQALPDSDLLGTPPTMDEVISLIDFYWQDARIAVFGTRAPAAFFDPDEKRFILRMDFYEDILLQQAMEEQLYLLVPPNDGRFYAPASDLADIHEGGADWLLIEHAWRSGWQLWRCVIYDPPEEESSSNPKNQRPNI